MVAEKYGPLPEEIDVVMRHTPRSRGTDLHAALESAISACGNWPLAHLHKAVGNKTVTELVQRRTGQGRVWRNRTLWIAGDDQSVPGPSRRDVKAASTETHPPLEESLDQTMLTNLGGDRRVSLGLIDWSRMHPSSDSRLFFYYARMMTTGNLLDRKFDRTRSSVQRQSLRTPVNQFRPRRSHAGVIAGSSFNPSEIGRTEVMRTYRASWAAVARWGQGHPRHRRLSSEGIVARVRAEVAEAVVLSDNQILQILVPFRRALGLIEMAPAPQRPALSEAAPDSLTGADSSLPNLPDDFVGVHHDIGSFSALTAYSDINEALIRSFSGDLPPFLRKILIDRLRTRALQGTGRPLMQPLSSNLAQESVRPSALVLQRNDSEEPPDGYSPEEWAAMIAAAQERDARRGNAADALSNLRSETASLMQLIESARNVARPGTASALVEPLGRREYVVYGVVGHFSHSPISLNVEQVQRDLYGWHGNAARDYGEYLRARREAARIVLQGGIAPPSVVRQIERDATMHVPDIPIEGASVNLPAPESVEECEQAALAYEARLNALRRLVEDSRDVVPGAEPQVVARASAMLLWVRIEFSHPPARPPSSPDARSVDAYRHYRRTRGELASALAGPYRGYVPIERRAAVDREATSILPTSY